MQTRLPRGLSGQPQCGQTTLPTAWALLCRQGPEAGPHKRNTFPQPAWLLSVNALL